MVTTVQQPIVDTQKRKRKESKHTTTKKNNKYHKGKQWEEGTTNQPENN